MGCQKANGAPKGKWGAIKAYGVPKRQMWVPKGKWGAKRQMGHHKGIWGAKKANVGAKRQIWVPKGKWGAIKGKWELMINDIWSKASM